MMMYDKKLCIWYRSVEESEGSIGVVLWRGWGCFRGVGGGVVVVKIVVGFSWEMRENGNGYCGLSFGGRGVGVSKRAI